jgi:hypothetical protein
MENLDNILTSENFKTALTQRLNNSLDERMGLLEFKFSSDLQEIEFLKYDFYDNLKKCKILFINIFIFQFKVF